MDNKGKTRLALERLDDRIQVYITKGLPYVFTPLDFQVIGEAKERLGKVDRERKVRMTLLCPK